MKALLFSFNTVAPMAILLMMGYLFRKKGLFTAEFVSRGSKLCFYVLLSCSLFKNLYDSQLTAVPVRLVSFIVVAIIAETVIGYLLARALTNKREQMGVIIQGVSRSNFAYLGIPLSTMIFTDSALIAETSGKLSIVSVFVIPLFNILAVFALTYFSQESGEDHLKRAFRNLLRNPCIISVSLGVMVLLFRKAVPVSAFVIRDKLPFIYKVIGYLATMSTPFSLLMVGAGMEPTGENNSRRQLIPSVLMKNLILPVAVFITAALIGGFNRVDFAVMISVFASPTAVNSAIMARQMGADDQLASEIVVYTTAFSMISLVMIIFGLTTTGCL